MPLNGKTRRFKDMGPLQNLLLVVSGLLHPDGIQSIPWLAKEVFKVSPEAIYKHLRSENPSLPLDRAKQVEVLLSRIGYPIREEDAEEGQLVINRKNLSPSLFKS